MFGTGCPKVLGDLKGLFPKSPLFASPLWRFLFASKTMITTAGTPFPTIRPCRTLPNLRTWQTPRIFSAPNNPANPRGGTVGRRRQSDPTLSPAAVTPDRETRHGKLFEKSFLRTPSKTFRQPTPDSRCFPFCRSSLPQTEKLPRGNPRGRIFSVSVIMRLQADFSGPHRTRRWRRSYKRRPTTYLRQGRTNRQSSSR